MLLNGTSLAQSLLNTARRTRQLRPQYIPFTLTNRVQRFKYATMAETNLPERPQGGESKKNEKKAKKAAMNDSGPIELDPAPAYLQHRIDIFEKLKKKQDEELASKPREDIVITLPDGSTREGKSWETSPADIARAISKSLFEKTVIARIDGEHLWDLERPFEKSCRMELLDFEHPEGRKAFWHSSAHVLGEAAERRFGCDLCIGPPVTDGFYYEMALPEQAAVQFTDYKPLETIVSKAVKEKQPFERLTLKKEDLLEMFKSNKYKQHIIKDKIPDGSSTTVYRCGPLIDLCRGPHVPHTGRIKEFKIMKVRRECEGMANAAADLNRTPLRTSSAMLQMTLSSVSTVSRSRTRSLCKNISSSSRKPQNVITARSPRNRNSSSFTNGRPDLASSCHMVPSSTTHSTHTSARSTGSVATKKLSRQTCTTLTCGRGLVTGNITKTTCSPSMSRRTSGR